MLHKIISNKDTFVQVNLSKTNIRLQKLLLGIFTELKNGFVLLAAYFKHLILEISKIILQYFQAYT